MLPKSGQDLRLLFADTPESITLPDGTTRLLGPAARDVFATFEDPCLPGNGEQAKYPAYSQIIAAFPQGARLFQLISINCSCPLIFAFLKYLAFITIPSPHCPSECSAFPFPLTLHGTPIIFLLLEQSWPNLRQASRPFSRCSSNSSVARRGW